MIQASLSASEKAKVLRILEIWNGRVFEIYFVYIYNSCFGKCWKIKEITTTFMQIVSNFFVSRQRCNTLKRERQRSFITWSHSYLLI